MALYATPIFDAAAGGSVPALSMPWIATLAYTFQLYFDFSGYSDMATRAGGMFGIKLPQNFNSPYKAVNITEFWRRWHITLSRFYATSLHSLGGIARSRARRSSLMVRCCSAGCGTAPDGILLSGVACTDFSGHSSRMASAPFPQGFSR